jgi:hypothetical protein
MEIMTPELRQSVIGATKEAMAAVPAGVRDAGAIKTTLLSVAVMARHMGYTRDELMFALRDEWGHMTALDSRTVVKGGK